MTMLPSRFPLVAAFVLLASTGLACGDDSPTQPDVTNDRIGRVLFLGNSLTYTNNLPVMVDSLAAASGIEVQCTAITDGGFGLIDHYASASRRAAVLNGHFDWVILQQGPSSLDESRDSLIAWSELWEPLIKASGAKGAMYAVWPERDRFYAFPAVSESYRLAAERIDALFLPVGDSWLETWARNPNIGLYGRDNFHPAVAGTYVAAVAIVSMLAGRPAISLSTRYTVPRSIGAPIDSTAAATIRAAVDAVVERNRMVEARPTGRPD
ncbi:MAG TPA: hypothetical protein VF720_08575 [Candidatus Eisenbacteria bacterium]